MKQSSVQIKDTYWNRNRGCGDLLLYGFIFIIVIIAFVIMGCVGK